MLFRFQRYRLKQKTRKAQAFRVFIFAALVIDYRAGYWLRYAAFS